MQKCTNIKRLNLIFTLFLCRFISFLLLFWSHNVRSISGYQMSTVNFQRASTSLVVLVLQFKLCCVLSSPCLYLCDITASWRGYFHFLRVSVCSLVVLLKNYTARSYCLPTALQENIPSLIQPCCDRKNWVFNQASATNKWCIAQDIEDESSSLWAFTRICSRLNYPIKQDRNKFYPCDTLLSLTIFES